MVSLPIFILLVDNGEFGMIVEWGIQRKSFLPLGLQLPMNSMAGCVSV
jgi:hypothetical protein